MTPLRIEPKTDTPKIVLDAAEAKFEISGKSLPEDVLQFYAPVFSWLDEYAKAPNEITRFKFNLEYYNSASSKVMVTILDKLEKIYKAGKAVVVEWHYNEEDEDMEDSGKEYEDIIQIPFEFHSYVE